MASLNNFSAQGNFLVFFAEFPASLFTEMSGGEVQRDSNLQHPGGLGGPVEIQGPTTVGQVTLQKPYDAVVDALLEAWATAYNNGIPLRLKLIKQPVLSDGVPLPGGKPDTYLSCGLVRWKKPDVRKGSAEAAMLEIVVQPERMI